MYIKNYYYLRYKINIIRLIMMYIFVVNLFRDTNVDVIFYKPCKIEIGRLLKTRENLFWDKGSMCLFPLTEYSVRPKISDVFYFQISCLTIRLIQNFKIFIINIIYFVKTYFIIRDILIIICLFYNLHKNFKWAKRSNKMSHRQKHHSF